MHQAAAHLPFAINYIDWMPLTQLFFVLKILLLPGAAVAALLARRRTKRTGIEAHQSQADLNQPRPMWANQTLAGDEQTRSPETVDTP